MYAPIITPARKGYSTRNRRRHTTAKRAAKAAIVAALVAALVALALS